MPRQFKDPQDAGRGLYNKFRVERLDGQSEKGHLHNGCLYFPLDLTHDPHALKAALAYADSCERDNPELAADLRALQPHVECRNLACEYPRILSHRRYSPDGEQLHCKGCGDHYFVPEAEL